MSVYSLSVVTLVFKNESKYINDLEYCRQEAYYNQAYNFYFRNQATEATCL